MLSGCMSGAVSHRQMAKPFGRSEVCGKTICRQMSQPTIDRAVSILAINCAGAVILRNQGFVFADRTEREK